MIDSDFLQPPTRRIRLADLESENRALREKLAAFKRDAQHNQEIAQNFHERELALLTADSLPTLLNTLTDGLRRSFRRRAQRSHRRRRVRHPPAARARRVAHRQLPRGALRRGHRRAEPDLQPPDRSAARPLGAVRAHGHLHEHRPAQRGAAADGAIESATQSAPQLLVIEDVHWVDSDQLARLGEIAAVVANCPILLIMTTRPEGDPISATWRAHARGCPLTTVDLAPLADDEAHELAAHYPELPRETIEACIQRAEGYPLFLDQLLRAASAGTDTLPGSVRTLVLARADRLTEQHHAALQAATVLGQRAPLEPLRSMIDSADYEPSQLIGTALVCASMAASSISLMRCFAMRSTNPPSDRAVASCIAQRQNGSGAATRRCIPTISQQPKTKVQRELTSMPQLPSSARCASSARWRW